MKVAEASRLWIAAARRRSHFANHFPTEMGSYSERCPIIDGRADRSSLSLSSSVLKISSLDKLDGLKDRPTMEHLAVEPVFQPHNNTRNLPGWTLATLL